MVRIAAPSSRCPRPQSSAMRAGLLVGDPYPFSDGGRTFAGTVIRVRPMRTAKQHVADRTHAGRTSTANHRRQLVEQIRAHGVHARDCHSGRAPRGSGDLRADFVTLCIADGPSDAFDELERGMLAVQVLGLHILVHQHDCGAIWRLAEIGYDHDSRHCRPPFLCLRCVPGVPLFVPLELRRFETHC